MTSRVVRPGQVVPPDREWLERTVEERIAVVWVRPSPENAPRVLRALASFGAPLHDLSERDLATPGLIFQIGVAPVRVDIITAIDGVEFVAAWTDRLEPDGGPPPLGQP